MIAGSDTENTEISRAAALLEEYSRQRASARTHWRPARALMVSIRPASVSQPPTAGKAGLTVMGQRA